MTMLDELERFPSFVAEAITSAPQSLLRTRAADGTFALVEQAWHLADLEEEGYAVRIERLLGERHPEWDDFRGDVVAEERKYLEQEAAPALNRFLSARARNVARLRAATAEQWSRSGLHRGTGETPLRGVAEMMLEHDRGHAAEIRALLRELLRPAAS